MVLEVRLDENLTHILIEIKQQIRIYLSDKFNF